ncbi:transcriptional activator RinB [Staphylococcus pasteuri]|uniref:transcriptional activator RinB n=1 Tax=Staphylococcus pasteuri TaxID=45972 RepID=UPI001E389A43|nr:transcriptional activator RinB [Staphylococcus pasteuri]MCD9065998.1 transcriptional activator RinB [Staphylococcus pasteuri]WAE41301.1 transcriptional activator RinB [Staphylococcus pasteuri]
MIKHILKLLFTLAMYELGKYVTNAVVNYYRYKEDDIDIPPQDFNQCDHIHLNAEVSD